MGEAPPASFPNFADKHASEPLFSPTDAVKALTDFYGVDLRAPDSVVLTWQNSLVRYLAERPGVTRVDGVPPTGTRPRLYVIDDSDGRVGVVGGLGIGSAVAAMAAEELIALGSRRIVNIGLAGGLQPDIGVGAVTVCSAAVRDEGVSHHYSAPERFARPSQVLTDVLMAGLDAGGCPYRVGPTWTIDAVYRETTAEARHYREEGVLTVEMEAAAVFAVGKHRGVETAAAFVVADVLGEAGWQPDGIWAPDTRSSLEQLLEASISTLASA
jgi:uridine phosphorylase